VSQASGREGRVAARAVRPAWVDDLPGLRALIEYYAAKGILLPRSEDDLRLSLGDFRVISADDRVLGCAVLHYYTPRVAEVRSLAVAPGERGGGWGRRLVEALLEEARSKDLEMVFALTYEVAFFERLGFTRIDRGEIPWKAWKDCWVCPKRDCCDETAVAYRLKPAREWRPLLPILGRPGLGR